MSEKIKDLIGNFVLWGVGIFIFGLLFSPLWVPLAIKLHFVIKYW